MTGYERDKQRYENGEMTTSEQVWYILNCYARKVVEWEVQKHGLNCGNSKAPIMNGVAAHAAIVELINKQTQE